MGVSLRLDYLLQDSTYARMAAEEYNLVTAGNECKTNYITKRKNHLDFSDCESLLQYSKANNMKFRGHVLIWANEGKSHYAPSYINNENDP